MIYLSANRVVVRKIEQSESNRTLIQGFMKYILELVLKVHEDFIQKSIYIGNFSRSLSQNLDCNSSELKIYAKSSKWVWSLETGILFLFKTHQFLEKY